MRSVAKLPNAAASMLTIGTTATDLLTAIRTAGSDLTFAFTNKYPPDAIYLEVQGESIRWMDDGNTPTSTQGGLLGSGGSIELGVTDLNKFKIIRSSVASGDATVFVRIGYINLKTA